MPKSNVDVFESFGEFLDYLDKTPPQGDWLEREGRQESVADGDASFCGTRTYAETMRLAKNGWPEGRDQFLKGIEGIAVQKQSGRTPTMGMDVAGMFPSVPAFCAGRPDHMFVRKIGISAKRPIVKMVMEGGVSGIVDKQKIINNGIAIGSIIDYLENHGISVELSCRFSVSDAGRKQALYIKVKQAGEILDVDRIAFTCAHPSMLRRLGFGWIERVFTYAEVGSGYGRPTSAANDEKKHWEARTVHIPNASQRYCSSPERAYEAIAELVNQEINIDDFNTLGDQEAA